MKLYQTTGVLQIYLGRLLLDEDQVRRRRYAGSLEEISRSPDGIICRLIGEVTLKCGEIFGYDGALPKSAPVIELKGGEPEQLENHEEIPESIASSDDEIMAAMREIAVSDPMMADRSLWTRHGRPEVHPLNRLLAERGSTARVTATRRDALWDTMNSADA